MASDRLEDADDRRDRLGLIEVVGTTGTCSGRCLSV
jgi:hypothetical protein